MNNTLIIPALILMISWPGHRAFSTEVNPVIAENKLPGTTDWLITVSYDTCQYPSIIFAGDRKLKGIVRK